MKKTIRIMLIVALMVAPFTFQGPGPLPTPNDDLCEWFDLCGPESPCGIECGPGWPMPECTREQGCILE